MQTSALPLGYPAGSCAFREGIETLHTRPLQRKGQKNVRYMMDGEGDLGYHIAPLIQNYAKTIAHY